MTQSNKDLLLKDLCARLPYGVKVNIKHEEYGNLIGIVYAVYPDENRIIVDELSKAIATQNVRCGGFLLDECEIKPYIRPMSSMTEEELAEWQFELDMDIDGYCIPSYPALDWLNAHHFDYRGLIKKGLALEAPEDMYKTE